MYDKINKKQQQKQEKERDRLHEETLARCIPIAKAINKIIVDRGLGMGDISNTRPAEYLEAAKEIQELLLKENIYWGEKEFIFQLARQPLDMLNNFVVTDLQKTFESKVSEFFGVDTYSEMKMQDIDNKFKEAKE